MREFIESLYEVPPAELFERARALHLRCAAAEWELAAILMAVERTNAYRERGFGSVITYAAKELGLDPRKARELLRVARIAERFALLSQAFRDGSVCWTKLREIARVVDADTEARWVAFARKHSVRKVEKAVARPPRSLQQPVSRLEYPTLFDTSSTTLGPSTTPQERVTFVAPQEEPEPWTDAQLLEMADEYEAQQAALKPPALQPDDEPPPSRLVRLTFVCTPEEYAVIEAALRKAAGQLPRRASKSAQLAQAMKHFLASGGGCSKARYPIVVQIDGDDGVYVTDRGDLPVEPARVHELLAKQKPPRAANSKTSGVSRTEQPATLAADPGAERPAMLAANPAPGAEQPTTLAIDRTATPTTPVSVAPGAPVTEAPEQPLLTADTTHVGHHKRRSSRRPNTIREVLSPTGWTCIDCGSRDVLELDHETPLCKGGADCADNEGPRCRRCHANRHRADLATDPTFQIGRSLALQRRGHKESRT